jgi:copper homeostasis protein
VTRGAILLEVCVDSAAGLRAAVDGGADRIELCAALALGGLTPSAGLIDLARDQPVPVRAMIRPRAGGFVYDRAERDILRRDVDAVRAAGLAGVVIGATTEAGTLDVELLRDLASHAAGMELTLHRAVDLVPDALAAVDAAIALGLHTILTSGGAATAPEGQDRIAAMRARAAGRIEILAGSGVSPDNVAALVAATGVTAVHASCSRPVPAGDTRAVQLGFTQAIERHTDQATVARLRHVLDLQQGVQRP